MSCSFEHTVQAFKSIPVQFTTAKAVPHATLIAGDGDEGDLVAIDFAGPTWQVLDGSSVVGDAAKKALAAEVRISTSESMDNASCVSSVQWRCTVETDKRLRLRLNLLRVSCLLSLNVLRQAYRFLQNFDELGDCRDYLGLFFPNREQFQLTLKFS
jgi:hypothetical protein